MPDPIAKADSLHGDYVDALDDWQTDQVQERVALWTLIEKTIRRSKDIDDIDTVTLYEHLDVDDALQATGNNTNASPPSVSDEPSVHDVLMLDEFAVYPTDEAPNSLTGNRFIDDGREFVKDRVEAERAANELVSYLKFGNPQAMKEDAQSGGNGDGSVDTAVNRRLKYEFSASREVDPDEQGYNEFFDELVTGRYRYHKKKEANQALSNDEVFAFVAYWEKLTHVAALTERLHETTTGKLFLMEQIAGSNGAIFNLDDVFRPSHIGSSNGPRVSKDLVEQNGSLFSSKRTRKTYFTDDWTAKEFAGLGEDLGQTFNNFMPALLFYHNTRSSDSIAGIELGSDFVSKRNGDMSDPQAFVGDFLMRVLNAFVDGGSLATGFSDLRSDVINGNVSTEEVNRLAQLAGIDTSQSDQRVKQQLTSRLKEVKSDLNATPDVEKAELEWRAKVTLVGIVADKGYDIAKAQQWNSGMKTLGGPKFGFAGFGLVMAGVDIYNKGSLTFGNTTAFLASVRGMVNDLELIDHYLSTSLAKNSIVKAAAKVAWIFNAIEMVSTGQQAYEEFDESDWDAATGMAFQSISWGCFTAAGLHAAGFLTVPGVGFVIAAGIVLAMGGLLLYKLGNDGPLKEWFKHCYYGTNWENDSVYQSASPTDTWFRFKSPGSVDKKQYAHQLSAYYSLVRPIGLEQGGTAEFVYEVFDYQPNYFVGRLKLEPKSAYGGAVDDVKIDQNGYVVVRPVLHESATEPVKPSEGNTVGVKESATSVFLSAAPLHMIRLGDGTGSNYDGTELDLYEFSTLKFDVGEGIGGNQLHDALMFYAEPKGRTTDSVTDSGPTVEPVTEWTGVFTAEDEKPATGARLYANYFFGFEMNSLYSVVKKAFVGSGNYVEVIYVPPELGRLFDDVVDRTQSSAADGNELLWKLVDRAPMVSREYVEISG